MTDDCLYLTVGVVDHATVVDDVVELPRSAPGAGRLLELALVAAQRVRQTPDDHWESAGAKRLVGTTVREAAQPLGARVSSHLAAKLGVADGDVLRLRPPTWRELAGQQERRKEVRGSVVAAVLAVCALVAAVVGAQGKDGASWPTVVAAAVAFVVTTVVACLRFSAAIRNQ